MQNILNRCSTYFFIFDPDNPFEIFEFVPQKKISLHDLATTQKS